VPLAETIGLLIHTSRQPLNALKYFLTLWIENKTKNIDAHTLYSWAYLVKSRWLVVILLNLYERS